MIFSHSEQETIDFARDFARDFSLTVRQGDIVLLSGDLGAGKSVFARSMIRSLSGQNDLEVPSPTFTLVQTYETPYGDLWHFDLYRLKTPEEIFEIGWEDAVSNGIVVVEWPDRLGPYIPQKAIAIDLLLKENEKREIIIKDYRHG